MPDFDELSITLPDGYRAYGREWRPSNPRGAVLYLHGIQSHCGWYVASGRRLAEAGYHVVQVDRRGCGRNVQDRGHAESAEQLIQDTLAARDELLHRARSDRYHMVGVSWGGKLAAASYVTDSTGVDSLSLVTPGLFPKVVASPSEKAEIGFAMLYEPRRLFDIPLNDPEMFTSSPEWQKFFRTDPLTLRQCTAGFYLASRRMDKIVMRLPEVSPVPIHLLLAEDERVIENGETEKYIRQLNWPNGRVTVYRAARHSLEFEHIAESYFTELVSFLCQAGCRS